MSEFSSAAIFGQMLLLNNAPYRGALLDDIRERR